MVEYSKMNFAENLEWSEQIEGVLRFGWLKNKEIEYGIIACLENGCM